jgi:acetyltransferase-like isoleucine patch superfamily enzyme
VAEKPTTVPVSVSAKARVLLLLLIGLLPSSTLKVRLLRQLCGWEVDDSATIGASIFMDVRHARIGPGVQIGGFNVFRHLRQLELDERVIIGRWNVMTGNAYVLNGPEPQEKSCRLALGRHACITYRHHLNCTGGIEIGALTSIGGVKSTILAHGADINKADVARVSLDSVTIGDYCLINSDVRIAPKARIPDRSIIAMGAVVVGELPESDMLYAGVPATPRKKIPDSSWFTREIGPLYD